MTAALEVTATIVAEAPPCRPFLKWAGGKSQLMPDLIERMPKRYTNYYEPFIGSGALFFAVRPPQAMLSDINHELINVYKVIRDKVDGLIEDLSRHRHNSRYFYELRGADRKSDFWTWSEIERASRTVFLNKTCFNGLFRVNSRGEFNVPFGDYKNPTIADSENLRACSLALSGADLEVQPFDRIREFARSGDFAYFDPPYLPLTPTANFTAYSKHGFGFQEHVKLRDLCVDLDRKGVKFMLSNSHTPEVLELFEGFEVDVVYASRAINSKGDRRGKVREVIVRNYH